MMNGKYIAALISAMLLQLCRRKRIHSDIPIVMFVAITNALRTGG